MLDNKLNNTKVFRVIITMNVYNVQVLRKTDTNISAHTNTTKTLKLKETQIVGEKVPLMYIS